MSNEEKNPCVTNLGKFFSHGNVTFYSNRNLQGIFLKDFTLLFQGEHIDIQLIPKEIKTILEPRWLFSLHHNPLLFSTVEQKTLCQRVKGGEIIAYTEMIDCSIEGNPFLYYGFLPTIEPKEGKILEGSHKKCRIECKKFWPRSLFIFIKQDNVICSCSENCGPKWLCRLSDYHTVKSYCLKKIPWEKIYIMMGDIDEKNIESRKKKRSCNVCDQCAKCAKSTSRCRTHLICKHKHGKFLKEIKTAKIKCCMKYRQGFN